MSRLRLLVGSACTVAVLALTATDASAYAPIIQSHAANTDAQVATPATQATESPDFTGAPWAPAIKGVTYPTYGTFAGADWLGALATGPCSGYACSPHWTRYRTTLPPAATNRGLVLRYLVDDAVSGITVNGTTVGPCTRVARCGSFLPASLTALPVPQVALSTASSNTVQFEVRNDEVTASGTGGITFEVDDRGPVVTTAASDVSTAVGTPQTVTGKFGPAFDTDLASGIHVTANTTFGTFTDLGNGSWKWTYTPTVGSTITPTTFVVTATDASGYKATDDFKTTSTAVAPVNTARPQVSGVTKNGQTLTGTTGSFSGTAATLTYAWQRCNSTPSCQSVALPAAVPPTGVPPYLLTSADVGQTIRLEVTATNQAGKATKDSLRTAVVTAAFSDVVLADSPIAYWRLGDAFDTSVMTDGSGHGHNGEYKNGATGTAGSPQASTGVSDDGNTDAIFTGRDTYGFVNNLSAPQQAFTIESWVKPTTCGDSATRAQMVFDHGGGGAIWFNGKGQLAFRQVGNFADSEIDGTLPAHFDADAFHHVVGTWDGTTAILYLDGVELGHKTVSDPVSGTATLYIGYGAFAPWFRGYIDEVAYYDHGITPAQVLGHYRAFTPPLFVPVVDSDPACGPTPTPTATPGPTPTPTPTATPAPTPTPTPTPTQITTFAAAAPRAVIVAPTVTTKKATTKKSKAKKPKKVKKPKKAKKARTKQ